MIALGNADQQEVGCWANSRVEACRSEGKNGRCCGSGRQRACRSSLRPTPMGAAQEMMVAGLDHFALMQAGGWKTVYVVARYVENASAQNLHQRRWVSLAG